MSIFFSPKADLLRVPVPTVICIQLALDAVANVLIFPSFIFFLLRAFSLRILLTCRATETAPQRWDDQTATRLRLI